MRLCRVGNRSIKQIALDLHLTETALREWVKRADIDAGNGPPEALTTAEREEMARLRRENKRLTLEREGLSEQSAMHSSRRRSQPCINAAGGRTAGVRGPRDFRESWCRATSRTSRARSSAK